MSFLWILLLFVGLSVLILGSFGKPNHKERWVHYESHDEPLPWENNYASLPR